MTWSRATRHFVAIVAVIAAAPHEGPVAGFVHPLGQRHAPTRAVDRLTWSIAGGRLAGARPATILPAAEMRTAADETCVIPTDYLARLALTDNTGQRTHDLGNYDACLALGNTSYCLLQIGADGGTPIGLCLPSACEPELLSCTSVTECEATVAWQYALSVAPILAVIEALGGNAVPIIATCGDGAHTSWPAGAIATVAALAALAAAVAASTLYAAAVPPPAKLAGSDRGARHVLDALARRVSLSATLPPVLAASPRRQRAGAPDFGAFDAVRALSTACVILVSEVWWGSRVAPN